MVSISDILKLLDRIPVWKDLQSLPKRVEALEKKLATIQNQPVKKAVLCGLCDGEMKVTAIIDHPSFGIVGDKQHTLTCQSCEHVETRRVKQG